MDEKIRKFEDCQDAYATSMFSFLSKEQEYTSRIVKVGGAGWATPTRGWHGNCGHNHSELGLVCVRI